VFIQNRSREEADKWLGGIKELKVTDNGTKKLKIAQNDKAFCESNEQRLKGRSPN